MAKCDADHGGNACNREAEYLIDGEFCACERDIAVVMEQNDRDKVTVERLYEGHHE